MRTRGDIKVCMRCGDKNEDNLIPYEEFNGIIKYECKKCRGLGTFGRFKLREEERVPPESTKSNLLPGYYWVRWLNNEWDVVQVDLDRYKQASMLIAYSLLKQIKGFSRGEVFVNEVHDNPPDPTYPDFDREKYIFLQRTSFKNVSGKYQFNGSITPERVFNIAVELLYKMQNK